MTEVAPPPRSRRRRVLDAITKAFLWLKNRRSSRAVAKAIASNRLAMAALATSVVATGVASYGAVSADEAQSRLDRVIQAQASTEALVRALQAEIAAAQSSIAGLADRADEGAIHNAAAFDALAARSRAVGRSMSALAGQVAAMPSGAPQTAALARQVTATAQQAQRAMQEAQKASAAAAKDSPDLQARAAAAEASQDAQAAGEDAAAARAAAERAETKADTAQDGVNAQAPFPRRIEYGDISAGPNASPVSRAFTVDLPVGSYRAVLTMSCDTTTDTWYAQLASAGRPTVRENHVGPADVAAVIVFSTGGGTQSFTVTLDGLTPGAGTITWRDIVVTFERT